MGSVMDKIWDEINELKRKYAELCSRIGTVEGKINVILTIGSGTLIAVITTLLIIAFGGK